MKTKIQVIQEAIDALENDKVEYNWTESCSCNCGILAQKALGYNYKQLWNEYYTNSIAGCLWAGKAKNQAHCKITGISISTIFETLFNIGFTEEDIVELENLSNKQIVSKFSEASDIIESAILKDVVYNRYKADKQYLIKYLKAWVELLKEEQEQIVISTEIIKAPKEEKVRTKYVVIHPQILEDADTLVSYSN